MILNGRIGYLLSYQHPDEYDVYFFDYSGYGLSTGKPAESIVNLDIESMYDHIVAERNDPDLEVSFLFQIPDFMIFVFQIILLGFSIGSAVAADLAAKNHPFVSGIILVAPLTSAIRHVAGPNPPKKTSKSDCFRT